MPWSFDLLAAAAERCLTDRGGSGTRTERRASGQHPHMKVWAERSCCPPTLIVVCANRVTRATLFCADTVLVPSDSRLFGEPPDTPACACTSCSAKNIIIFTKDKVSPTMVTIAAAEQKFGISISFMSAHAKDPRWLHPNALMQQAITSFTRMMPSRTVLLRTEEDRKRWLTSAAILKRPSALPALLQTDPLVRHYGACPGSVFGFLYAPGADLAAPINPTAGLCLTPSRWKVVAGAPLDDMSLPTSL